MEESKYKNRIVDKKIEKFLNIFGSFCIEGPKWCGKHGHHVIMQTANFWLEILVETFQIAHSPKWNHTRFLKEKLNV